MPMNKDTYTSNLKEQSLEDLYYETGLLLAGAVSLLTMFYFWISACCLAGLFAFAVAGILLSDKGLKATFLTACAGTIMMLLVASVLQDLTYLAADLILKLPVSRFAHLAAAYVLLIL